MQNFLSVNILFSDYVKVKIMFVPLPQKEPFFSEDVDI